MSISLRIWLTVLLVTGGVIACTDHQFVPSASQRMRLKTTNNINSLSSPWSTEYTYDASNRVMSFTTSMGTRGLYYYDGQNRYRQFDYFYQLTDDKNGETTLLDYNPGNTIFTRKTSFIKNGNLANSLPTVEYALDGNRRLVSITTNGNSELYHYTGDNITSVESGASVTRYEYDDKPNPYYGLIAPDIGEIRRFSRNNITKISNGNGVVTSEYTYEYNAQELPTLVKQKNSQAEVRYTYESY